MNRHRGIIPIRRTVPFLPLSIALLLTALPSVAGAQGTAPTPGTGSGPTTPATMPLPPPGGSETPRTATATADVPEDYRVDIGDLVNVNVTRHDDVSRTLRIPADGKLRLPRLEKAIAAKGKTCSELADLITERLRDEGKLVLRPGQVTVSVVEMRVRRIYVRGNAAPRNGDFDLKPGWRITELVAVLGGVQNPERVTARLYNPDRPKPVTVNLNAALTNPDSTENVALQEGDTLTLELPHNKRFYVKGEGPRGAFELDERFGLRQALIQIGFSTTGATGDLRHCTLVRRSVAGDPNSEEVRVPIDVFALMTDDKTPDVPLQDMDTLDIPVSLRFVYIFGKISGPKRIILPEYPDGRQTRLVDIMSQGDTYAGAKIDDIKIWRVENGQRVQKSYKFGKYLANGDEKQNPEILPGDMIFVPDVKRGDTVGAIWTSWGFYNILQTIIPGIRPH